MSQDDSSAYWWIWSGIIPPRIEGLYSLRPMRCCILRTKSMSMSSLMWYYSWTQMSSLNWQLPATLSNIWSTFGSPNLLRAVGGHVMFLAVLCEGHRVSTSPTPDGKETPMNYMLGDTSQLHHQETMTNMKRYITFNKSVRDSHTWVPPYELKVYTFITLCGILWSWYRLTMRVGHQ